MEDNIAVDEIGLVRPGERAVLDILLDPGLGFRRRDSDLEERERFIFPDLSVSICQSIPV